MKRFSREEKAKWLEGWQQSGQSIYTYARKNGLVPQTFNNWVNGKNNKPSQLLVEIPNPLFQLKNPVQEILIEKGDIKIHIPLEPVLNELQKMISGMGGTI